MFDKLVDLLITTWEHFKPIFFILEYEQGVVLRAGTFLKVVKPGWHLRIPFVDDYFTDNVTFDTIDIREVNVTTLDGKTLSVGCKLDIEISDIKLALVNTHDWRSNLIDICRGIISDHLEDCNWEDIRKKTVKNAIEKRIQKRAEEMGINVTNLFFTDKALSRVLKIFNN